jgi:hypothetical protein
MPLSRQPKYPSRRAYLLIVRSDAMPDALTAALIGEAVRGPARVVSPTDLSAERLLEELEDDLLRRLR